MQAGGWLAAVARPEAGTALREVMRHDPAEPQDLQALRDGDPDQYLEHEHNEAQVEWGALSASSALSA